jgi:HKD family nuclease
VRYIDSGVAEAEQGVAHWMQRMASEGPCEFRCQTGYFTAEGSGVLLPQLQEWSERELPLKLLIGSNQAATLASHVSYLAGALRVPRPNIALGIVSFQGALFHPKVYHFRRADGSETAYVGSANLTGSGLSGLNVEAGVILDTREDDDPRVLTNIREHIDRWFEERREGLSTIASADDIQRLLDEGYLSLRIERPEPEAGQSERGADRQAGPVRPTRRALVGIPRVVLEERGRVLEPVTGGEQGVAAEPVAAEPIVIEAAVADRGVLHYTEASFHYPQGTHLGHILTILWRFATGRDGTSFDDEYIRLRGSLGNGRLAAYRRQIKYKMLAAIEMGLVDDIRLSDNPENYRPALTQAGGRLWELLAPHVNTDTLIMGGGEELSSTLPERPSFYNLMIRDVATDSAEFADLYRATAERMPAVRQMQQFVAQFEDDRILKNDVYQGFFAFEPVVEFCNEVGIDPATEESARHRCPFLLNILESLGQIDQDTNDVVRL